MTVASVCQVEILKRFGNSIIQVRFCNWFLWKFFSKRIYQLRPSWFLNFWSEIYCCCYY